MLVENEDRQPGISERILPEDRFREGLRPSSEAARCWVGGRPLRPLYERGGEPGEDTSSPGILAAWIALGIVAQVGTDAWLSRWSARSAARTNDLDSLLGTQVADSTSGERRPRARQNVVFELGFFIAALGRSKVAVLHEEDVELPSDMSGVLYTALDAGGAWKLALGKELRAAGLAVDLNRAV